MMATAPVEMVKRIAHDVALERRLPWRLAKLRDAAVREPREAAREASRRAARAGLSLEQLMIPAARRAVRDAAKGMEPLPLGAAGPASEQMAAAFEAFSVREWDALIADMGAADVRALWAYVREHREGRKAERIEALLIMREDELWQQENRGRIVGHVQDPYLAVLSEEQASEANRRGEGRGMAERAGERNVARALTKEDKKIGRVLKVTRHQVKEWRKCAKRYPFEQYLAEHPGEESGEAFINYWSMISKPYQRNK